ncbi:MAG: FAD-dependent oxidoreductase [Betaproteobacteria bacterium]
MGHPLSRVVIVGAGVIGLCTAWYCRRRGFEVTVVDRESSQHVNRSALRWWGHRDGGVTART